MTYLDGQCFGVDGLPVEGSRFITGNRDGALRFHPYARASQFSYYAGDEKQHLVTFVPQMQKWAVREGTRVLRYRDNLVAALSELERVSGVTANEFYIDA